MVKVRAAGESVRRFIIENLEAHPTDIVKVAAERFGCTRQAVHKHLRRLVVDGSVNEEGTTRNKVFKLAPLEVHEFVYRLADGVAEDVVWRTDVAPALGKLPDNVREIWQYGFTEMLNNVIDHSAATRVQVEITKTAASTTVMVYDDGVGIFRKIQLAAGLLDERHAVLELAKGKFTTDPANHSGEGIFFSSRMFDEFVISSGGVFFSHTYDDNQDWVLESSREISGTLVEMVLHNHTSRTAKSIFDKFVSDDDYGFTKTVVPVRLLQYGDENLVSRSQAKRLLARFDRFKTVVLDFDNVASIGQAFADEVFRVFVAKNPGVSIVAIKTSPEVRQMISRATVLLSQTEADAKVDKV
jgi:anti-sigma regulatory factor (Ser/Thr protein kinase)